jgi:hypothetical protein
MWISPLPACADAHRQAEDEQEGQRGGGETGPGGCGEGIGGQRVGGAGEEDGAQHGDADGGGELLNCGEEDAREFCERQGWQIVGATQDIISGTVAPMKRKDLGRWLTDPARLHSFDVIVFAHIDRISRGTDGDLSDIES